MVCIGLLTARFFLCYGPLIHFALKEGSVMK